MKLYTVGYEGCDIDDFVKGLKRNKINCLIDVRKNPVSRKKGFSKSKLRESLNKAGIEYEHFSSLGVPSAWRKKQKAHLMTRKKMFDDYTKKILPIHQNEIEKVIKLATASRSAALLCYEANALDCHRHFLTEEILKHKKFKVVDLILEPQKKSLLG